MSEGEKENYEEKIENEELFEEEEEEEEEANDPITEFSQNKIEEDHFEIQRSLLRSIIHTFNAYIPDITVSLNDSDCISFYIPSFFLPMTLRVAYQFTYCNYLVHVSLILNDFDWTRPPERLDIVNSEEPNFAGRSLIFLRMDDFFTKKYDYTKNFRSAPIFISGNGTPDPTVVQKLVKYGFKDIQSKRAAILCNNNFDKCMTFLQTGKFIQKEPTKLPVSYSKCPLMYFFFEIFDAILDLQDHCSICGKCTLPGLKPSVCSEKLCQYKYLDIGIGTTVAHEISRDPFTADLLFTLFACSYGTMFCKCPNFKGIDVKDVIKKMPPMKNLANCSNDIELAQATPIGSIDVLRWVILACRSNFLMLPDPLKIKFRDSSQFKGFQFMALTASPEQESIFQQLKKKFGGSRFLWHGSSMDRWHSIIMNGLVVASGTNLQQNGAALGNGIYFAPESSTSEGYCNAISNPYVKSCLGGNLRAIALCEVVSLPLNQNVSEEVKVDSENGLEKKKKTVCGALYNHGWAMVLTMKEAVIVRFLFINFDMSVNVSSNPPTKLPTLGQVLAMRARV